MAMLKVKSQEEKAAGLAAQELEDAARAETSAAKAETRRRAQQVADVTVSRGAPSPPTAPCCDRPDPVATRRSTGRTSRTRLPVPMPAPRPAVRGHVAHGA
jgi:hypothetical protein